MSEDQVLAMLKDANLLPIPDRPKVVGNNDEEWLRARANYEKPCEPCHSFLAGDRCAMRWAVKEIDRLRAAMKKEIGE